MLPPLPDSHRLRRSLVRLGQTGAQLAAGVWLGLFAVGGIGVAAAQGSAPTIGLPITRSYSIAEIGVTRGPDLNFDRLGRLAVIGGGSYVVLNDGAWVGLHDSRPGAPIFLEVVHTPDGRSYFGALALWGEVTVTADGTLQAVPLRPREYPAWVHATNFTQVLPIAGGVLFSGLNGIVHLRPDTGEQRFFEIPDIATTFTLGGEVFVSSHSLGTGRLDPVTGTLEPVDSSRTVHLTAELQDGRIVAATTNANLLYFDGKAFSDTGIRLREERPGGVSSLQALPDGGFAVAVDSEGLFLFTDDGDGRMALTTTGYRRVYDLAAREPGVLWIAMESSIEKLLYNDPVSVIDQRSDVVIGWPQVFQWGERTVIASNGRLYDMLPSEDQRNHHFVEVKDIPRGGTWAVAANGRHLLVGNNDGVYARSGDAFRQIPGVPGATRLFLQEEDLCVVVGNREIVAMRWSDGQWAECAERIPAVGFPSVAQPAGGSLWIELGLNRAARIWFAEGRLHTQLFESFPWDEPTWINIGAIGDHVVLSGASNQRVYIDARTGARVPPPPIEEALANAPVTILRVAQDDNGVIWITHPNGVMTLRTDARGHHFDARSLGSIRDLYPVITLLNRQDAWISTESALYHVAQTFAPHGTPSPQPFLVSIRDGKSGVELFSAARGSPPLPVLPYAQNHLEFRFFSGGYTTQLDPVYEFTMQSGAATWNVQSADSMLTLPQLEEGRYRLTARVKDGDRVLGEPVVTAFVIRPPWYRSPVAYAGYWSSGLLLCAGGGAWIAGRAKRKHAFLEELVRDRTEELRTTMAQLTEEARTSATLAERNRLAGEIHDSLQQGLSGLALHLETTLKKHSLDADLRGRLTVAMRMVSFTRQEVQQAVWDLESPLLQHDSLTDALRNLADLIGTETTRVTVETEGAEPDLSSTVKHHLLRIAQEGITNAVRHSGATHVRVGLEFSPAGVRLAVRDDGRGFVLDEVLTGGIGHFGLRGLRSRAQKLNGDLHIISHTGQGTEISITVPLGAESPVLQETSS